MDARTLPTGTVAFLFTDVEGSTRLWERDRAAMAVATADYLVVAVPLTPATTGLINDDILACLKPGARVEPDNSFTSSLTCAYTLAALSPILAF